MRSRFAVIVLALLASAAAPVLAQLKPGTRPTIDAPNGWPRKHPVPELPPEKSRSAAPIVPVDQRSGDTIEFMITTTYDVGSALGAFGLTRKGVDASHGTLARGDDGIYRGSASLVASGEMKLPGQSCGAYGFGWQYADVVAVPIPERSTSPPNQITPFYNAVHRPGDYRWISGGPAKGFFRLEFHPRTAPRYNPKDDCQEEIPGPHSRPTFNFVPLNDAQWTIEGMYEGRGGSDQANRTGYAIAVPESGEMVYEDRTSENQSMKVGAVDLAGLVKAKSIWYVTIKRTVEK